MKKATILLLVLFLGLLVQAGTVKKGYEKIKYLELKAIDFPLPQAAVTGNGIRLRLLRDDKLPVVSLEMLVRGGSAYDPADKVGLADVTAELLRIGGAAEFSSEQMDQLLDARGIEVSISSASDYFTVSLSCLQENFPEAVSLLAKMLRQPRFAADKLDEVKVKLSSSIARRNDSPAEINRREFNRLIYGPGSPFGAVMEYDHLENITLQDVRACHQKYFAAANLLAGLVGPLEMAEIIEVFEKNFGDWQARADIPAYPPVQAPTHDFKVAFAEKTNLNQSYIAIGQLGVKEDAAEKARILIFNAIFSQGFDSRLFVRVRSKMGLTYGVGGGIFTQYWRPGQTYFTTFTKSNTTLLAIKAIFDEMDIIRKNPVSPKELLAAKDYFSNSFVFKFSSPERIMNSELQREFYGLPADYQKKLLAGIKGVTAEDVLQAANRYLDPQNMIVMVVGKEKDLDGKLGDLGPLKAIDIAIPPPTVREKIAAATPETLRRGRELLQKIYKKNYSGYANLKSARFSGSAEIVTPQGAIAVKTTETALYPDKFFREMALPFGKMEIVTNGAKGVQRMMGQEEPLPEAEMKKGRFGEPQDVFTNLDKYNFQYLGEEKSVGKVLDVVYATDAEGRWIKFFINRASGLIEMDEKPEELMGQKGVYRQVYSNFKTMGAIAFPTKAEMLLKDKKVMTASISDIVLNIAVDPALFAIK
jgi:zinc protease